MCTARGFVRLLGLACACLLVACGGGGDGGSGGDVPAAGLSPDAAAPGEAVRVVLASVPSAEGARTTVTVGGQSAPVVRVIDGVQVEVLVPRVAPGVAEVIARDGDTAVGRGQLTVLESPTDALVLSYDADGIGLLRTHPAGGGWWDVSGGAGERLYYDVLSASGGLVFTGSVPHPVRRRREVFADPVPGAMRLAVGAERATFALKIPHLPQAATVRFYELEPGTDPRTTEGRAARHFVGQVVAGVGR